MSAPQAVVLGAALATFGSFAWAILAFFRRPDGRQPGMTAIAALGNLGALLHLAAIAGSAAVPAPQRAAGLALYAAALALFWWTVRANRARPLSLAFSGDVPYHLVTAGPYRVVRHPFYAAYTLAWLAGPVATGAWWLLGVAAAMFGLYWRAARLEERKFGRSAFAGAYRAYMRRTGMFVPRVHGGTRCSTSSNGG